MNRKAIITGTLIVAVILLVGAAVGVPAVIGYSNKLTSQSEAEIRANRWVAMTEYYSQLEAERLTTKSEADVRANRWAAMTDYYSQLETGGFTTRSPDGIRAYPYRILPPGR